MDVAAVDALGVERLHVRRADDLHGGCYGEDVLARRRLLGDGAHGPQRVRIELAARQSVQRRGQQGQAAGQALQGDDPDDDQCRDQRRAQHGVADRVLQERLLACFHGLRGAQRDALDDFARVLRDKQVAVRRLIGMAHRCRGIDRGQVRGLHDEVAVGAEIFLCVEHAGVVCRVVQARQLALQRGQFFHHAGVHPVGRGLVQLTRRRLFQRLRHALLQRRHLLVEVGRVADLVDVQRLLRAGHDVV